MGEDLGSNPDVDILRLVPGASRLAECITAILDVIPGPRSNLTKCFLKQKFATMASVFINSLVGC